MLSKRGGDLPRIIRAKRYYFLRCTNLGVHDISSDQVGIDWEIQFSYYALELAENDVTTAIEFREWNPEANLIAFSSMCRAVQRLHKHEICHRDLKPSNFLVMPDGSVKLSDLGTACKLDGKAIHLFSRYTFAPGDRRYSSPEMLACLHDEDPRIGYKCDFFSLGAILFELFTGAVLGLYAFDLQYYSDLSQFARAVKPGEKHSTFNSIVDTIKANHPLPDLEVFGAVALPAFATALTDCTSRYQISTIVHG